MGRRSRKRSSGAPAGGPARSERDAARAQASGAAAQGRAASRPRRRGRPERPPPPWGSFPLTELVILLGLVLAVVGLIMGVEESGRARTLFGAGIVLGMLGGLEIAIRDHFAGYRSHTTLLSGAVAVLSIVALTLLLGAVAPGLPLVVTLVGGAIVFAVAFPLLRRTFQRRSGGLSFR